MDRRGKKTNQRVKINGTAAQTEGRNGRGVEKEKGGLRQSGFEKIWPHECGSRKK